MYSYHNRIIQRIKNDELVSVEKGTGEFFAIFVFNTSPYTRPIREYAVFRYEKILKEKRIKVFWQ